MSDFRNDEDIAAMLRLVGKVSDAAACASNRQTFHAEMVDSTGTGVRFMWVGGGLWHREKFCDGWFGPWRFTRYVVNGGHA